MDRLREEAERWLGLPLSRHQLEQFERYFELLLVASRRVNLTTILDRQGVEERHFLDSLTCWLGFRDLDASASGLRLIDVGSGAGLPGIPLKIARPELRLALLDSGGKRTAFLRSAVDALNLDNVEIVTARAEDACRNLRLREAFDVAVARALAPLPVLLEYCLPFLRLGGRLVAPRRGELEVELAGAEHALHELGGGRAHIVAVPLPCLADGRALVVVEKTGLTPPRYPRRAGVPERRPL